MRLEWSRQYIEGDLWTPSCCGIYLHNSNGILFFALNHGSVNGFLVCEDGIDEVYKSTDNRKAKIPGKWLSVEDNHYLMFSEDFCISLDTFEECDTIPPSFVSAFRNQEKRRLKDLLFLDGYSFTAGDYVIRRSGAFTYHCFFKGERKWALKTQGYLYTPIREYKGKLLIGTAGQGGRFYEVSLDNGDVVSEYNTGGTCEICYRNGIAYFPVLGRESKLVSVSLEDGIFLGELSLRGGTSIESRMYIDHDKLFISTYEFKTKTAYRDCRPARGFINCISLD